MSHTAFEITTVAANCKNVQSLACWKNFLMVGCSDGTLHLYQTPNTNNSAQFDLIKTIPKFSRQKKAIVQLKVVEKWSMLLCLSDTYVCLHDLASFNFIKKMRTTRYCNTFCIHEDEGMLCCSVNKQLIIFKWDGQQFLDYNELDLPSNAKTISFLGPTRLCVGFRREYDLLDVETGDILRELVRTGKSEKPVLTTVKAPVSWLSGSNNVNKAGYKKNRYAAPGELLVSKDSWGIFFGQDGNASRNTSEFVQWTNCPISCMTAFPYLVSITPDAIEVHHVGTLRCAQLLTMNNANCIICSPSTSDSSNRNNNNGSSTNSTIPKNKVSIPLPRVFVSTSNSVHMLTMTPVDEQLNALAEKLCFPEAISLCQLSKNRLIHVEYGGSFEKYTARLYGLRWQFIRSLFQTSNYSRALTQCKEGISDPLLVISLFPGLAPDGVTLSVDSSNNTKQNKSDNDNTNAGNNNREEQNNIDRSKNEYMSSFDNKAITALLIPYLLYVRNKWKHQIKKKTPSSSGRSPENGDDDNDLFAINRIVNGSERLVTLKQLIDTCLLTAYIRTNASTSTIREFYIGDTILGCDCLVEETEALLLDMPEKWEALIWLYYSNDFHQKALDWLGEIQPAKTQPPYPSIKVRITKTVQYLHTLMGKISQSVMLPTNKQFSQHNNIHGLLVMEYFQWVFQQDPFFALKLFTSFTLPQQFKGVSESKATPGSIKAEIDRIVAFFSVIDPLNILDHIKAQETSSETGKGSSDDVNDGDNIKTNEEFINSVCITFLEFALLDLPGKFLEYKAKQEEDESYNNKGNGDQKGKDRSDFYSPRDSMNGNKAWSPLKALEKESLHEHLILLYLDAILRIRERQREKLRSPSKTLGPSLSAEKEPGTSGDLRRRLLRFLKTSKIYRPEKVLSKFQKTTMYEERAILLRSAGRHEEALQIYVHDLGNLDLAAEYCEEVYQDAMKKSKVSERSEGNDVYMKLMRTCLVPVMRRKSSIDTKTARGWGNSGSHRNQDANLIKRAVKLLRAHSSRIDIVEAIRLLPDTSEISELTPYFSSALKNIASQRRNNQIIKNMLKLEQLNAMKEQAILKSRSVVVDRDTRCQKCGHPFTARSVPAVFPDMSIYHVACSVESDEYEGY
jgi:hypothetical protein